MEVSSVVYGTIRRWDGLIHLHAIPMNGSSVRGLNVSLSLSLFLELTSIPAYQWLYRGYLTSNGNWIGRSRDTWTSDIWREGYEGVFVMTRR